MEKRSKRYGGKLERQDSREQRLRGGERWARKGDDRGRWERYRGGKMKEYRER